MRSTETEDRNVNIFKKNKLNLLITIFLLPITYGFN